MGYVVELTNHHRMFFDKATVVRVRGAYISVEDDDKNVWLLCRSEDLKMAYRFNGTVQDFIRIESWGRNSLSQESKSIWQKLGLQRA